MAAHLHFHGALDDDVKLLARVGGKLDGHVLLALLIGHGDKEGLGGLVFKQGGHIQVFKALAPGDGQAVTPAVDGVGGQGGGNAFDQVSGVNAKALGALIDEGEAEILLPCFALFILLPAHPGAFGHFIQGKAGDLPHGADAFRHLGELCFQICFFHIHVVFPFPRKTRLLDRCWPLNANKKPASKESP